MTLNRREFVQFAVDDHVAIHNLGRRIFGGDASSRASSVQGAYE